MQICLPDQKAWNQSINRVTVKAFAWKKAKVASQASCIPKEAL